MQKTQRNVQKYLISAIALALLSACGGSGNGFISPEKGGGFIGSGNNELKDIKGLEPNLRKEGISGKLLVNDDIGNGKTLSNIGQQNSPSVALVDENHSGDYDPNGDVIKYDQVSYLSSVCLGSECGTPYTNVTEKIDKNIKLKNDAIELVRGRADKDKGLSQDDEKEIAKLQEEIADLEDKKPKADAYFLVNTDAMLESIGGLTVDTRSTNANANQQYFDEQGLTDIDAGVIKIDKERNAGKLYYRGGTIGRRFNGIHPILVTDFENGTSSYRPAYMRQSVPDGWSYQTFVRYFSVGNNKILQTNRDLLHGYQSVGNPTPLGGAEGGMPKSGWADYSGIAHALINGKQVTMENKIHAEFGDRRLRYETVGNPYLHTFEKNKQGKLEHVIEQRPELRLTGQASWEKGKGDFNGTIRTEGGGVGTWKGRFYGPEATEIGGVFGIEGKYDDGNKYQYIGGFGGKR